MERAPEPKPKIVSTRKTIPIHMHTEHETKEGVFDGRVTKDLTRDEYRKWKKQATFGGLDPEYIQIPIKDFDLGDLVKRKKYVNDSIQSIVTIKKSIENLNAELTRLQSAQAAFTDPENKKLLQPGIDKTNVNIKEQNAQLKQFENQQNRLEQAIPKSDEAREKLRMAGPLVSHAVELGNSIDKYRDAVQNLINSNAIDKSKERSEVQTARKEVEAKLKAASEGLPGLKELESKIKECEDKIKKLDNREKLSREERKELDRWETTLDSLKGLKTILLSERYGLKTSYDDLGKPLAYESSEAQKARNEKLGLRYEKLQSSIAKYGPDSPFFNKIKEKKEDQKPLNDNFTLLDSLESIYMYAQDLQSIDSLLAVEEGMTDYLKEKEATLTNLKAHWFFSILPEFLGNFIIVTIQDYYTSVGDKAEDIRLKANNILFDILGISDQTEDFIKRRKLDEEEINFSDQPFTDTE